MVQCKSKNRPLVQLGCRRTIWEDFGNLKNCRVKCISTATLDVVVVLSSTADHFERRPTVKAVAVHDVDAIDLVS